DVAFAQNLVRRSQAFDSVQPEFLRQSSLPSPETPFSSSARLRGIGRNHLDPQLGQSPAHLCGALAIDRLARFPRVEEMAGTIAVELPGRAFPFDDFPKHGHYPLAARFF